MPPLSEKEITSLFTGLSVNPETLKHCAHKNVQASDPAVYIVYSCGFLYDQELRELFGVTDKLKDLWERRGTEFNISLHITDDKIIRCGIDKYTESGGARASCNYLKCTQQEPRIARRILSYATQAKTKKTAPDLLHRSGKIKKASSQAPTPEMRQCRKPPVYENIGAFCVFYDTRFVPERQGQKWHQNYN